MAERGKFIVLEGIDHSGKTTQAQRLAAELEAGGCEVVSVYFPNRSTAVGTMINEVLRGAESVDDHALHLLFAANRWEYISKVREWLERGVTVVCDRYVASGAAYSMAKGLDKDWCLAADAGLPVPDVVIFLDLSVAEAAARGDFGRERFETVSFQEGVRAAYQTLMNDGWVVVDAAQPADDVETAIRKIIEGLYSVA